MPKLKAASVFDALIKAYFDLGYAQAGFNIHDCSESMHDVDKYDEAIERLADLVELSTEELDATWLSYCKGYATYAHAHDVFDEAPSKDNIQADELTPVSGNTLIDFEEDEGWAMFCNAYQAVATKSA